MIDFQLDSPTKKEQSQVNKIRDFNKEKKARERSKGDKNKQEEI